MTRIGAHVSASISLNLSLQRANEIGAECTQIFISPPQQWAHTPHTEKEIGEYRKATKETRIRPNFIHSSYLINLGSIVPEILNKSIDWLIYSQKMAGQLGMVGTIFHVGSYKDNNPEPIFKQVISSIEKILAGGGEADLIIENSAGAGNLIGDRFKELGRIIRAVGNPKLKVCLDTQHSFASGYDWRSPKTTNQAITEFDREIGLDRLVVIHANDSMTELGSNRDRHANIGEGLIGRAGFTNLLHHASLKGIPFILEVPGFSGNGPDRENITLVKKLANS